MKWVVLFLILSTAVAAYDISYPVDIEEDYFYEYDRKVIENRDISNPEGDCVVIKESEWVVIRNNYIHDCTALDRKYEGYAIIIEDVDHLIIENNIISDSARGIYLENVGTVTFRNNAVSQIDEGGAIILTEGTEVDIVFNTFTNVQDAIIIISSETVAVENNNISLAIRGISLYNISNSTPLEVLSNNIQAALQGIALDYVHGVVIEGNTLRGAYGVTLGYDSRYNVGSSGSSVYSA